MKSPNLNIYKVQMVYFFKENSEFKAFGLISSLYQQLKHVFTTEPQSLPLPNNAPKDVPRCIWNGVNTNLTFSMNRLEFSFNIPTKFQWKDLFYSFNQILSKSLTDSKITIDRVGTISELTSSDDLHSILNSYIEIPQFKSSKEVNISWLENLEDYNVWTYFSINENQTVHKVVFDINSLPENKLSEEGILSQNAMNKCACLLERKMKNVL